MLSIEMTIMGENGKTVSVVRCEDYGRERVYEAVKKSIELLGGIGQFVSPGQKVFVKFNMLLGAAPETCISTHPDAVYAVARLLKEHGCHVVMGDSPGSGLPYTENVLKKSYASSGYDKVSEELGIPLNYDTGFEGVPAPEGRLMKRFSIIKPAIEADAIVVVSKAKTHSLTNLSGAAKNIFGLIPGLDKPVYHANFQNAEDFSRVIIDLNEVTKPRLQVMDAIMAMEGDGPHSGTPKKIGAVLVSGDYNAIDVATARLMSIDPKNVSTIRAAIERGYLSDDLSDVAVVGDPLESLIVKDFKGPSTYSQAGKSGTKSRSRGLVIVGGMIKESALRPHILKDQCIGCMKCMRSCPVKAITVVNKKPSIDYKKCIRCYCCHEMCDDHAIALDRSLKGKVINEIMKRRKA
jgi:uncharacterized protein (DUF362 family)/NAD-dependent dihydropyrimidine dehydrogenase PreA subunit